MHVSLYMSLCSCVCHRLLSYLPYLCTYVGDTGLRGPIGETGTKGAKGDQGNNLKFHKTRHMVIS